MPLNINPHRTYILLAYCVSLPLRIEYELLHLSAGAVGTTQTSRQVGFLLLYYKPVFIILWNCSSQPTAYGSNSYVYTTQGMMVENKLIHKRFRYHDSGSRII